MSNTVFRLLRNLKMNTIFIIFTLVFTLIPSLAFLLFANNFIRLHINNYSEQYLNAANDVLVHNLSDTIYQINMSSITLTTLPNVTITLTSDKSYEEKKEILHKEFSNLIEKYSVIDGIIIKTNSHETYSFFNDDIDINFDDEAFFNSLTKTIPSIYSSCIQSDNKNYIVFGRHFFNFDTGQEIGNLMLLIDEEKIFSMYSNTIVDNINFFLTCNDIIISHNDKSQLNSKLFIPNELYGNKKLHNEFLIYKHQLDLPLYNSDMKMISLLSFDDMVALIDNIKMRIYITFLIILLISLIVSVLISKSLTNPIVILKKSIESYPKNPDIELSLNPSNEIYALESSFDKMIIQIKNLVRMNNIEKEKQKNAELRAMQAQISPHFIYNALDTAYCMAKLNGQEDIEEIIYALASFFRLGLHNASRNITVKDELEHVKSFLIIEKLRFPNLFDVYYDIDERILNYKMIGVILQPLVENSIKHGFKDISYKGELKITGLLENNNTIIFTVSDNGNGMVSPPELKPTDNGGYGLYNVNERLTIAYGSEYGLKFETKPSSGTIVKFKININT